MSKTTLSDLKWIINQDKKPKACVAPTLFSPEVARKTRGFHRQIPGFRMTPLRCLPNLAHMFNVGGIWVKDESVRMQLNSFKVLGGSYAVYKYIKQLAGCQDKEMTYEELVSPELKQKLGKLVFATATDGNHGRGVAWAASKLGFESVIYVHAETSKPRIDAIRGYGATVHIVEGNYDDAVQQVQDDALANGWTIVSDTSWDGYTQIPTWIMQGYCTLLGEAQEQFAGQGISRPTHVFVQAGVGALAAAVVGYYHSLFPDNPPKCIVVEPEKAECLYQSALAGNGEPVEVTGKLDTIMAGLACGKPSPIAWEILKECADCFVTCPDYVAAKGMRVYATPLHGDPFIISGESGAVTLGAMISILRESGAEDLRNFLQIDQSSQVLFVNTEGNTDPIHFRQIIWEGANPVPHKYWTNLPDNR